MHKILHVISDTNFGGAGKLLLTFLANFNRDEFDISVVLPKGSLLAPEVMALDIRTIEIEGISDKTLGLSAIKKLRELFEEEKPELVHTHAALSARIAAKMMKLKVVHTRHSVHTRQTLRKEPGYKKRFPYKHLVGALNNYLSDLIIATSPVAKISMVETGTSQRKTIMVYNGIDGLKDVTDDEKKSLREKYGLSETDFVCSIVARLEVVKGHEYVLKAAQMLQRESTDIKILIVGIGDEEERIKRKVTEMELENCVFTGFVKDIREIMGITDLQINASRTETTNIALLEGLSIGVPAVASDSGGNPFVINDGVNGVLFEEGDYMALSKAILEVKNNPKEYEHLSRRAREIFAEKFDSKVMTARVEEVYRKLLDVKEEGRESK